MSYDDEWGGGPRLSFRLYAACMGLWMIQSVQKEIAPGTWFWRDQWALRQKADGSSFIWCQRSGNSAPEHILTKRARCRKPCKVNPAGATLGTEVTIVIWRSQRNVLTLPPTTTRIENWPKEKHTTVFRSLIGNLLIDYHWTNWYIFLEREQSALRRWRKHLKSVICARRWSQRKLENLKAKWNVFYISFTPTNSLNLKSKGERRQITEAMQEKNMQHSGGCGLPTRHDRDIKKKGTRHQLHCWQLDDNDQFWQWEGNLLSIQTFR